MEKTSKAPRILVGDVLSHAKMLKTIVVAVKRTYKHDTLRKVVRSVRKYKVHDEQQEAKTGDVVEIFEGRPVSKTKYMYLHKIISRQ